MLRARNPESCTLAAGRHSNEASRRLKFIQHCRSPEASTGSRFVWRTRRFMQNHTRVDFDSFPESRKVFTSLHHSGSNTLHKFQEARPMRSRWISLPQLYLRQKLIHLPDETWKTRARSQLRLILKFRRGGAPPPNVPLRVPPLACDLRRAVRTQIRFIKSVARVLLFICPQTASLRSKASQGLRRSSISGLLTKFGPPDLRDNARASFFSFSLPQSARLDMSFVTHVMYYQDIPLLT